MGMILHSNEIELRKKITEALTRGKYLITITYVEEGAFSKDNVLRHYSIVRDFPDGDIVPTFEHLLTDIENNKVEVEVEDETMAEFMERIKEEE